MSIDIAKAAHRDFVKEFDVAVNNPLPAKSYLVYKWPVANSIRNEALDALTKDGIFDVRNGNHHLTKTGGDWAYGIDSDVMDQVDAKMRVFVVAGKYEAGQPLNARSLGVFAREELNAKQREFLSWVIQKWETAQYLASSNDKILLTQKGFDYVNGR